MSTSPPSSLSVRQRTTAVTSSQQQLQRHEEPVTPIQEGGATANGDDTSSSPFSRALTSTANLANFLPTGTLLAFQFLAPAFSNHGACDATTALLTQGLLAALALSCLLASFTDTLRGPDGRVYYGLATPRGLWLLDYPPDASLPDTSRYRLESRDAVHAALSVAVFGAVAARDQNVVRCFYPAPATETEELLDILPLGVGVLCSLLFVAFPTRRHRIGYPVNCRC